VSVIIYRIIASGSFFGNQSFYPSPLDQPSYDNSFNSPFAYQDHLAAMMRETLSPSTEPFMLPSPLEHTPLVFPSNEFDLFSPFSDQGAYNSATGNSSEFSWNLNENPVQYGNQQGSLWDSPSYRTEDPKSPSPKVEVIKSEKIRRNSTRPKFSRPTTDSLSASAYSPSAPSEHSSRGRRPRNPKSPGANDRSSHNAIEKRYRQNLNAQIEALWTIISSLPAAKDIAGDLLIVHGDPSKPPSKPTIIASARALLIQLEKVNALAEQEITKLKERTLPYQQSLSSRPYPRTARMPSARDRS